MNEIRGESRHLLCLQSLVYGGAVLLLVGPISTWPGTASALAAAVAALVLSGRFADRLRLTAVLLGSGALLGLGLLMDRFLGRLTLPALLMGPTAMSYTLDALTFGLVTLGAVLALRTLVLRVPALAVFEAGTMVGALALTFAAHRDLRLGQPRFLTDWTLTRGLDPLVVLLALGMMAVGAVALLRQRQQTLAQTAGVVLCLLLIAAAGAGLLWFVPTGVIQSFGGSGGTSSQSQDPWPSPDRDDESKPVAVVLLHDQYQPHEPCWYFRQTVCSQFNGRRLVRATQGGIDTDVPSGFDDTPTPAPELPGSKITNRTVSTTVHLIDEFSRPIGLISPIGLSARGNPDPSIFRRSYAVESRVAAGEPWEWFTALGELEAGDPGWSRDQRRHYLDCPEDPRYGELAAEIMQVPPGRDLTGVGRRAPLRTALMVQRWIERNTTYSKRPGHTGLDDPAAEFLFGNRRGYCVHIAHGTVYLLRTLGIPSRVAMGFSVPAERPGSSSSITVMSGDAHAWPEIYLHGAGWIVLDPALESVDPRDRMDREPDRQTMQELASRARRETAISQAIDPQAKRAAARHGGWMWLLAAILPGLYGVKVWRRLAPRFVRVGRLYRDCYRAVLDRLAEVGLVRGFGETREEFARRVAILVPEFEPLTQAHLEAAVGNAEHHPRRWWITLVDRNVQRLGAVVPGWRRAVGIANPVSWWWAR